MKQFILKKAIYQYHEKDHSFHLLIQILLCMVGYRILKTSFVPFMISQISFLESLLPIFLIISTILLSYGCYYIGEHFIEPKQYQEEECLIDGLLLGLLLPIKTPIILIVIAVFITVLIGRYFYEKTPIGVPALIGMTGVIALSIWLQMCNLANSNVLEILIEYREVYSLSEFSVFSIWTGNVMEVISKTSPILCLLAFFLLVIKGEIKWRIPVYFILCYTILLILSNYVVSNSVIDIIKQLGSNNLLFLVIFCATDKRTTPVTESGQILFATFLSIFTYITTFFFTPFLSLALSILFMNFLTPIFDYFGNYYQLKYCNEFIK